MWSVEVTKYLRLQYLVALALYLKLLYFLYWTFIKIGMGVFPTFSHLIPRIAF